MMVNIIDLGTIVKEDIIIYLPDEQVFTISGQLRTELVLQMMYYQQLIKNKDSLSYDDYYNLVVNFTYTILKEDKDLNISPSYIAEHYSLQVMHTIIDVITSIVADINNDDNLTLASGRVGVEKPLEGETGSNKTIQVEFMRNFATLTKYYGLSYQELLDMPYSIFLSYLKYVRVFELEKTEEGREQLELSKHIKDTEPDLDGLRNLKI